MASQALKEKIKNLPDSPGVYFFLGVKKEILYIGKATSLRDRVKSYFSKDIMATRGPLISKMIGEIVDVKYVETDSVLEALILEAHEIRKNKPLYNSKEKDDKSYNYVVITREEFPRLILVRGRELEKFDIKPKPLKVFGPFPHGSELREALKIVRKIFPYRDEKCKILKESRRKPCFPAQLGLCPGPCAGWVSKEDYRRYVRHLTLFFEAKKSKLVDALEKDMKKLAKEEKFEEAERAKKQIYALNHIQDVALIKRDVDLEKGAVSFRIEAYDIAHLSGREVIGVMTVVEAGEVNKSQYRKFKIRKESNNDTANLKEVLERRLAHMEWRLPRLIVVDGGKAQLNTAKGVIRESGLEEVVGVVSVVKDERHKAREILGLTHHEGISRDQLEKHVLLANVEAHRFAINYHRLLRNKGFRI